MSIRSVLTMHGNIAIDLLYITSSNYLIIFLNLYYNVIKYHLKHFDKELKVCLKDV